MKEPLRIGICEDDQTELDCLVQKIEQSGHRLEVTTFLCGEDLLETFSPGLFDLIFLDIYLEGLLGIEAAAVIRKRDPRISLALVTSSKEHALEAYRVKACAYIEKPPQAEELYEVLELAWQKKRNSPSLKVLVAGEQREIALDSILYFEIQGHALSINTLGETVRTSQTVKLKDVEPLLPPNFFRCHYSFIVNLNYVKSVNKRLKIFTMTSDEIVHIRHSSFKSAFRAYENQLFEKARDH